MGLPFASALAYFHEQLDTVDHDAAARSVKEAVLVLFIHIKVLVLSPKYSSMCWEALLIWRGKQHGIDMGYSL